MAEKKLSHARATAAGAPNSAAAARTAAAALAPNPASAPNPAGAVATIDEYIAQYPEEIQKRLTRIRGTIRKAAPRAVEKISWRMPTFWQKENLIHFAAMKNHIGLYPGADGVAAFAGELAGYKTSKGAIQLPHDKELPLDLIARITRFRVQQAEGQ